MNGQTLIPSGGTEMSQQGNNTQAQTQIPQQDTRTFSYELKFNGF